MRTSQFMNKESWLVFDCEFSNCLILIKKDESHLVTSTPQLWFALNPLFVCISRHSQVGQMAYRSRQSLSSPSPGGTEMDLLVMRERPRRGIRNSGYDVSHLRPPPYPCFSTKCTLTSHSVPWFSSAEDIVWSFVCVCACLWTIQLINNCMDHWQILQGD